MNLYQDIECVMSVVKPVPHHPVRVSTEPTLPIGNILESARLEKGMTLKDLSERVKIRPCMLAKFESSQCAPDVCAMQILQKELGLQKLHK